jgi:branched-chain amino acid transport system permease protein
VTEFLQALILGLLIGGVYALLASGLTLIFGVMNVINIAHGAFLILAAFITWSLWRAFGLDPLAAIVVLTPLMFAFGWLLYNATIRPIRRAPPAASVLLTFGLALFLEGVMGLIWGNTSHSVRPGYSTSTLVLVSLYLVLTRSWLGRAIRASAVNPQGAELVGVKVTSVAAMTFAIGVASAGAGGAITSVLYPFLPGSHYQWIARLLGIIVLGGMGSLPGAVIGALCLGVAELMTVTYIGPEWATGVPYVFVFIVLLLRPQGILGTRLRQDVATA